MKLAIRYVSLGSREALILPVRWLGCKSWRFFLTHLILIHHLGSTKSVCSLDAIINRSLSHTKCTPRMMIVDGTKVQPSRKRSLLMSILNLLVFGKFEVRRSHVYSTIDALSTSQRFRDTVNSVGIIPRTLPFTKTNDNIRYFRHALSLDERRVYVVLFFFSFNHTK